MKTTALVHQEWARIVNPGDTIIDATCGNGHDTLFLVKLLQGKGSIFSFDIQKQALESAKALLSEDEKKCVTFILSSHEDFPQISPKLIVYNLGYLPGGNKEIVTKVETTLKSIQRALEIVTSAISITCYPGHEEGVREEAALLEFVEKLPSKDWEKYVIKNGSIAGEHLLTS